MMRTAVAIGFWAFVGFGAYVAVKDAPSDNTPSCANDWRLCADNADLMSHNISRITGPTACRTRGDEVARYGAPEWPFLAFSSYRGGNDAVRTGRLTLYETNARFGNLYGAKERVAVTCVYDLAAQRAVDLSIEGD